MSLPRDIGILQTWPLKEDRSEHLSRSRDSSIRSHLIPNEAVTCAFKTIPGRCHALAMSLP